MTGRQGYLICFLWIPARDDNPPAERICFNLMYGIGNLIHAIFFVTPIRQFCGTKVAPLMAIHRPKISRLTAKAGSLLCCGPFIPDTYFICLQRSNMSLAAEHPE